MKPSFTAGQLARVRQQDPTSLAEQTGLDMKTIARAFANMRIQRASARIILMTIGAVGGE